MTFNNNGLQFLFDFVKTLNVFHGSANFTFYFTDNKLTAISTDSFEQIKGDKGPGALLDRESLDKIEKYVKSVKATDGELSVCIDISNGQVTNVSPDFIEDGKDTEAQGKKKINTK